MKHYATYLTIMFSIIASSCSNSMYSMSYAPVNEKYAEQLSRISIGMSKQEVSQIIPNTIPRGQTRRHGSIIEANELKHNYWSGIGGSLVNDAIWFYYKNNTLVKWGKPNDWPEKADLIIETRAR